MHEESNVRMDDYIEILDKDGWKSKYIFVHVCGINDKVMQFKLNLDELGTRTIKRPFDMRCNFSEVIRRLKNL